MKVTVFFNDGGNNPEATGETLSLRHAGTAQWWQLPMLTAKILPGGALVDRFGGTAELVKSNKCNDLVYKEGARAERYFERAALSEVAADRA